MPPQAVQLNWNPNKADVWDWRSYYTVVDPTDKEVITFTLWERQLYLAAGLNVLTYFAAGTTGINGNLPGQGQLPAGWFMRVQAVRIGVFPQPTESATAAGADAVLVGAFNDVNKLITTGTARINVGDKQYGRWPIYMLPGGGGPYGHISMSSTNAAGSEIHASHALNGPPDPRAVYTLPINIGLPPQYNFTVTLEWPTAVVLATATGASVPIFVKLDGQLMRPKQ